MRESSDPFDRWLADLGTERAVEERRRSSWLTHQDTAGGTWAQLLVELAERGLTVVVETSTGRAHRGKLQVAGDDFCVLRSPAGDRVLVRRSGIVAVRSQEPARGSPEVVVAPEGTFVDALGALADAEAHVVVRCAGSGTEWRGEMSGVGPDRLDLLLDGGGLAYVPLESVVEVLASG